MMMVHLSFTKLQHFFLLFCFGSECLHLLFHQSAEDAIAEQAKQQEDDPYANLSKKEKKKKKKQVSTVCSFVHWLHTLDLYILHVKIMRSSAVGPELQNSLGIIGYDAEQINRSILKLEGNQH